MSTFELCATATVKQLKTRSLSACFRTSNNWNAKVIQIPPTPVNWICQKMFIILRTVNNHILVTKHVDHLSVRSVLYHGIIQIASSVLHEISSRKSKYYQLRKTGSGGTIKVVAFHFGYPRFESHQPRSLPYPTSIISITHTYTHTHTHQPGLRSRPIFVLPCQFLTSSRDEIGHNAS